MAATRVISVIGKKDAGKTSLVVALASEWVKRGRRVATIKHGSHPADVDTPGTREEADPLALTRRYLQDAEIVVVEGFKKSRLPKIEVHRRARHPEPLFSAASSDAALWVAVVTDDEALRLPVPTFRFGDTGWLVRLADLAWDRAVPVE